MGSKVTDPLAKAWRTSEGILTGLALVVLTVGSTIDPSKLPPKYAGILGTVLTVAHLVSRTGLKAKAITYGAAPAQPDAGDAAP